MNPLCTFLLPSRKRVRRLVESITSLEACAPRSAYRIHVRAETDDEETCSLAAQLLADGRVDRVLVEPPAGYGKIHLAWSALLPVSTPWMWVWSDDTLLHGDWVAALSSVPTTGVICHAETVTNNASRYRHAVGGPFPVVPGGVLAVLNTPHFPAPIDTGLDEALRLERGWRTHFLPGVTVQHDRLVDDCLQAERY